MPAFSSVVNCPKTHWGFLVSAIALALSACGADNTEPSDKKPVAIEVSKYALSLPPTTDTALTATITGTDLNEPITWSSSAPGVVTVRDDGPFGIVTGVAEGTATIYAMRKSDPKFKSPPVTVTVARVPALKAFTVDAELQQLIVGDSRAFALFPARAEARATVTYAFTSSNPSVATVNTTTGVVTSVGAGSAIITATATGTGTGLITNSLSATAQVLVDVLQSRFRHITAGAGHSCALKSTGEAYCWGSNSSGQLGDGTVSNRAAPTPVVGGIRFSEISAGYQHTCGLTNAGEVYCWGINTQGRLGDGTTATRLVPTLAISPKLFTALEVGGAHTCALTAAGTAYCWGDNMSGQLGSGTQTPSVLPALVQLPGVVIKTITTGLLNTCVTSATNIGYCWGSVAGNGITGVADSGVAVGMYALGQFHKCLLSTAGRLYCPNGGSSQRLTGLPNAGPPFPYVLGVVLKSIIAGDSHTCGISLRNDAYCWGAIAGGSLGNSGAGEISVLPMVTGGLKFAELAAGEAHTCGITTTNQVYCWGSNSNGQLGSAGPSSTDPKLVPFTP